MSQKRVAMTAGITRAMVSTYESGSRLPSLPTLERLLDTFGASFAELEAEMRAVQREDPGAGSGGGVRIHEPT